MGQSPSSNDYNLDKFGLPFLQGNADFTNLYPRPRIWCNTANKTTAKNDILLSVRAPIGAVNIADQDYGIGRGLCAIRGVNVIPKLLFYIFLTLNDELNSVGTGSTYTAISTDDVKNIAIPRILISEQRTITNYDHHHHPPSRNRKNRRKGVCLMESQKYTINPAIIVQTSQHMSPLIRIPLHNHLPPSHKHHASGTSLRPPPPPTISQPEKSTLGSMPDGKPEIHNQPRHHCTDVPTHRIIPAGCPISIIINTVAGNATAGRLYNHDHDQTAVARQFAGCNCQSVQIQIHQTHPENGSQRVCLAAPLL